MKYLIKNLNTDPTFNLSLEEYFLSKEDGEYFCFWRNSPSVIIGRNQDALAEVDFKFLRDNEINLVRRLSGGGAVFHDLGNINYSYITNASNSDFCNFDYFSKPVISALSSLGINAELNGRNDIVVDGKKISGNAQHISHGRILHHGTLLFNSDLSFLGKALKVDSRKLKGKGIESVRSRVTNICEYCPSNMDALSFLAFMEDAFINYFTDITEYHLSNEDISSINELAEKRYRKEEWNLIHSGKYTYQNSISIPSGIIQIGFNVNNGAICDISITGDFFGQNDISLLCNYMIGTLHSPKAIADKLQSFNIDQFIQGCSIEEFLSLFF